MSDPARKSSLKFALAVAAVLALLPLGYLWFLRAPPPASLPPPPPVERAPLAVPAPEPEAPQALTIAEIEGKVEVRKAQGEFVIAKVGDALEREDALRTTGGRARLSADKRYEVQVEAGTYLEVGELTRQLSRFKLGQGMLVARVEGGSGQRLEVAAANSDATASTGDGTFAMSSNGQGTVAVGARAGEVDFKAAGKAVVLRAGEQSISTAGGAPSAPAPIPSSLFLKVDWPKRPEVNKRRLNVSGRTTPGTVLLIGGQPVAVAKDGRFRAAIQLREGRNVLEAEGLDVAGNRASGRTEVRVDTTGPDSDIRTQKLWEK